MKKLNREKSCCENKVKESNKGILSGLLYGLIPHIGCIGFILFTALGITLATALFRPFLLNPYFFHILVAISLIFATISAFFYLKNQGLCSCEKTKGGTKISFSLEGIKKKWKYLLTLYGTTILTNVLLIMVVFPLIANLNSVSLEGSFSGKVSSLTLQVNIPCPGHAPLITEELKKTNGVFGAKFKFPNLFDVAYDPTKTSTEQILSLEVFKIYSARVVYREKF